MSERRSWRFANDFGTGRRQPGGGLSLQRRLAAGDSEAALPYRVAVRGNCQGPDRGC